MIDEYFWNYEGTGNETNGETRARPNPGFHYYEHSLSRAQLLAQIIGLPLGDLPE